MQRQKIEMENQQIVLSDICDFYLADKTKALIEEPIMQLCRYWLYWRDTSDLGISPLVGQELDLSKYVIAFINEGQKCVLKVCKATRIEMH